MFARLRLLTALGPFPTHLEAGVQVVAQVLIFVPPLFVEDGIVPHEGPKHDSAIGIAFSGRRVSLVGINRSRARLDCQQVGE